MDGAQIEAASGGRGRGARGGRRRRGADDRGPRAALALGARLPMGRRLAPYRPAWYEEPVSPNSLELLREVKQALPFPIAAGERLYTLEEFYRLTALRAADVVQPGPGPLRRAVGGARRSRRWRRPRTSRSRRTARSARWPSARRSTWIGPPRTCGSRRTSPSTTSRGVTTWLADGTRWGAASSSCRIALALAWSSTRERAPRTRTGRSFPALWDQEWLTGFTQNRQ